MHAYTLGSLAAFVATTILDLWIIKTKVALTARFWITVIIVGFFQVFVDGWLTKLSSPIVIYNSHHFSGIRVFFSTPIEDFIYGFALILLTLSIWSYTEDHSSRRDESKA